MKGITFVGMDAHKSSINVAMLLPGDDKPVEWQVPNQPATLKRMLRRIEREAPDEVRTCYEAGPCGYALQRQITAGSEASCMVVAPSLIPVKSGERVKTDRRDARKLAFLMRAGMLTEVQPPSEADEAPRDLCRAREDAREDLLRCRHRLNRFLLRRGIVFTLGKRPWTVAHRQWLHRLRLTGGVQIPFVRRPTQETPFLPIRSSPLRLRQRPACPTTQQIAAPDIELTRRIGIGRP